MVVGCYFVAWCIAGCTGGSVPSNEETTLGSVNINYDLAAGTPANPINVLTSDVTILLAANSLFGQSNPSTTLIVFDAPSPRTLTLSGAAATSVLSFGK